MADSKITDYAALTGANLAPNDQIEVVDVSDTSMHATGTNKNMTADELAVAMRLLGAGVSGFYVDDLYSGLQGFQNSEISGNSLLFTPGANVMVFGRILPVETCQVDGAAIYVQTAGAAGAKVRVGIYPAGAGVPTSPVLLSESGEMDVTTTGLKTTTFTAVTLNAFTVYATYVLTNSATVVLRTLGNKDNNNAVVSLDTQAAAATSSYMSRDGAQTYGVGLSSPPSTTPRTAYYPPGILWKVRRL